MTAPSVPPPPTGRPRSAVVVPAVGAPVVPAVPPPPRAGRRTALAVPAPPLWRGRPWWLGGRTIIRPVAFSTGLLRWTLLWLALWVVVPTVLLQWQPVAIVGESMAPMIRAGDVVLADPDMAPFEGSVVTYQAGERGLITHRVRDVTERGELRLRGDANTTDDPPVAPGDVLGVARLLVPVAASPVAWAHAGNIAAVLLSGLVVFGAVTGRLGAIAGVVRRRAATLGPLLLVVTATAVLVPSQALLTDTTSSPSNALTVHQVTPATGVAVDCTKKLIGYEMAVTWTPSTSFIAAGQEVQRSVNGGAFSTVATLGSAAATHTETVTALGTVSYRVRTTTSTPLTGTSAAATATTLLISCSP